MSSPAKKKKFELHKKSKFFKKQNTKKDFMEPGQSGFFVTCNFRERDCVRESYSVLNEYADLLFGKDSDETTEPEKNVDNKGQTSSSEDEEDISQQLANDIAKAKQDFKKKSHRFQVTDNANVTNCVFIKANVPDVVELGSKIVKDIFESKQSRTKSVLRFIPVELVCKANIKDMVNAAGKLFDKHFLKESKTFSIVFNHRMNNSIRRDDVTKELAALVQSKNINNKVDLTNPQVSVVVEVLKGLCCLSVLPDYFKYKKYNLTELVAADKKQSEQEDDSKQCAPAKEEDAVEVEQVQ